MALSIRKFTKQELYDMYIECERDVKTLEQKLENYDYDGEVEKLETELADAETLLWGDNLYEVQKRDITTRLALLNLDTLEEIELLYL